MTVQRFVVSAAKKKPAAALASGGLLLLLTVLLWTAAAAAGDDAFHLGRRIEPAEPAPGETVSVRFALSNGEDRPVSVTVTEEIPPGLVVLDPGDGAYNETARFVVWRTDVPAGHTATVGYDALVEAPGELPLYAYATTGRSAAEDSRILVARAVGVTLSLDDTTVRQGDDTVVRLTVENPFDRPLDVSLFVEASDGIPLSEPWPPVLRLAPREVFSAVRTVRGETVGAHSLVVTPRLRGIDAGPSRRATLTVFDGVGGSPRETVVDESFPRPGEAVRTHRLTFPPGLVQPEEALFVAVSVPEGAAYVPGTTALDGDPRPDPELRAGRLLFAVPHDEHVTLTYRLMYDDARRIGDAAAVAASEDDVGVLAVGALPRVLRGDDGLLVLLEGGLPPPERLREGVVLLNLYDGLVVASGQIDIEVDGPAGSVVGLAVNGQLVDDHRIGARAADETLGRDSRKYIAVPLQVGANDVEATAEGEGLTFRDRVTVYRTGPPTRLVVEPATPLVTDRIHPLVLQISAYDQDGRSPADGAVVTVAVEGADILSSDVRPEWLGHQVELRSGRAFVLLVPPAAPTELRVQAEAGDASVAETFRVTARVSDWAALGHGALRAAADGSGVAVETRLRAFARGPVGEEAVLTVAVNTDGLALRGDGASELWTGDTSSSGAAASGEGPLFVRLERGLSYVTYGRDEVRFDGRLAGYVQRRFGLHGVWRDVPGLIVRGFYSEEPLAGRQEELPGDGTGYYLLQGGPLEPFSEQIAVVVRDATPPYDVVQVWPLPRTRYYLDDVTGQIVLAEPLPAYDEQGRRVSLRVRYRAAGEGERGAAAGVYAAYSGDGWEARVGGYVEPSDVGEQRLVAGVGGHVDVGGFTVGLEAARSRVRPFGGSPGGTEAGAYGLSVAHDRLFGGAIHVEYRRVEPDFVRGDDVAAGDTVSWRTERVMGGRVRLSTATSATRPHDGAPWERATTATATWLAGRWRPEVGATWRGGEATASSLAGRVGLRTDGRAGGLRYAYEWPLRGDAATRHRFEWTTEPARERRLQLSVEVVRNGPGVPAVARVGLGFTQAFVGRRATTHLRGGYELPGHTDVAEGHYVLGAETRVRLNERHTVALSVDHRRPVMPTKPTGFGGALGWKYQRGERGESEWRIDFRREGAATKTALQWRGLHEFDDNWSVRGDALVTFDEPGRRRTRVGLGAAYRGPDGALLLHVARDQRESGPAAVEWRVQAAWRPAAAATGSVGYARRDTGASATDKVNVALRTALGRRFELQTELSYLRQEDTASGRFGAMVGLGYELAEHVWLTAGYGTDNYVGFDVAGAAFARTRSGVFLQLDFAFDEWSLRRLFGGDGAE